LSALKPFPGDLGGPGSPLTALDALKVAFPVQNALRVNVAGVEAFYPKAMVRAGRFAGRVGEDVVLPGRAGGGAELQGT